MERIEREKHGIEPEKIDTAEAQRKEDREAAERHDQLLSDMEKATNGRLQENQERIVSFCNSTDGCKTSPDDFDRKGVVVWIFSFMTIMMMMMASCIGQCTCTLSKIFRKGTESCSKRIRGWLPTCCLIECCRISIICCI